MSLPIPFLLPKSQKGLKALMAVLFVICFGAAITVYVIWSGDQALLKEHGQPDFNSLSQGELKDGLIVKGRIDLALDVYAEEYETTVGIRTDDNSERLYYVVPIYHENDRGAIVFDYLLTYEANPGDFETMDAVVENTWTGESGPIMLTVENARILNTPADIKNYLVEWYENPEFYEGGTFIDWSVETGAFDTDDRDVIISKITPYMIDRTDTAGTDPVIAWIFLGLSIVCLIILLVLIFRKGPEQRPQSYRDRI